MRIFLSCQQSLASHPVPAYQFWETYFKQGIEEAGHQWIEAAALDWAEGLSHSEQSTLEEWRNHTWEGAVNHLRLHHQKQPVDLFLGYLFPQQVKSEAVREIQALGIPCVNFFCDNVREFVRVPDEFRCFDLHWVPEFKALKMYRQAGLKHVHAPMPVWIPPEQRICDHPENYGVTFIGSRDAQREVLFADVLKLGVPLELRGAGWSNDSAVASNRATKGRSLQQLIANQADFIKKHGVTSWTRKMAFKSHPAIADEVFINAVRAKPDALQYIEVTQQSMITLGVNRYPSFRHPFDHPDTYSRMRDLEAPMMGACYLTEWTEGLDQLYELGEEIETYRTAEELAEKIRELQANPERRQKMRCRGQKRALTEHTIAKSIAKITVNVDL